MFAKQFEATPCERLETTFREAPRAGLSSKPVIVRSYLDRVGGSPRTSPLRVPRTFWFRDLLLDVGRSLTPRRSMTPGVSYSSLERLVFIFGPHCAFPLDRHFVSHRISCRFQEEPIDVVLRFEAETADDAAGWLFHPSQSIEREPGGGLLMRFRASGVQEMCWHLFTWGTEVTILAPERIARCHG